MRGRKPGRPPKWVAKTLENLTLSPLVEETEHAKKLSGSPVLEEELSSEMAAEAFPDLQVNALVEEFKKDRPEDKARCTPRQRSSCRYPLRGRSGRTGSKGKVM